MDASARLATALKANPQNISKVVDFDEAKDRLYQFDLTKNNPELSFEVVNDVAKFSNWIDQKLVDNHCRYGIGGYMELRTIYDNREQFETSGKQRQLHLGVDIWTDAGTPVYAPLDGVVHSFQDNAHFGDYGPTIILKHQLGELIFYSLYGHLNRECLINLSVGMSIKGGQHIANFGAAEVNGGWPPHLHFQLMLDMEGMVGDYPGACHNSDKAKYLQNIPDPALLLKFPPAING
ncbi:peptidoglycan DD-metalloendopeptidase family protein [Mucilaginibacter sp. E4BP6]|uniref:peptidoglycan DD-metalloendopeptidase family protein n=1 Tax=Mucilaginibacter sp. E4BP6 TaxID=2723089 RepID=UPI0015C959C6|nr:peptidoglycan DD-metalloendopeptidase family protein [Mucilaginibacter sp. E4BP6]NYE68328.1 murein DD-endopeptidase MepM/ murein hydrolase activator NlpD [Mucilaginibacter sp. E4BP6]